MYNGLRWDCSSGGSRRENHPPTPPPFFYQNEAQRAKKHFLGDRARPLSQDLDDCPPPPLSEGLDLPLCRLMEKTLDNEKNDFFHNSNN